MVIEFAANTVVLLLNFVLSKAVVFRKKRHI